MSLQVDDLDAAIDQWVEEYGYRLNSIFPADNPEIAVLSKDERTVSLSAPAPSQQGKVGEWVTGRAGMQYRDLVPRREDGTLIVSHIRIPQGGPVPDYVHFHEVRFQMIYVVKGWVKVVYEDQGDPFVMNPGDCVLQPPGIRHRVLESSDGLEVIEIASPAHHVTYVDHDMELPNRAENDGDNREWEGQRFCFHRAGNDSELRDTGIAAATSGMANVFVARPAESNLALAAFEDGQSQSGLMLKIVSNDFEMLRVTLEA